MTLHQASGRWRLGLLLAAITALCWATLPVALKIGLEQLDAYTLTWFRFLVAALVMGGWLAWRGQLGGFRALDGKRWRWLALAALGLIGNYVFYLLGVQYTTPANAQLLIQLAPLLMALGGIFVFGERYNRWQWLGMAVIVAGLLLFFRDQWQLRPDPGFALGVAFVVVAAVVWAGYALLQKQLLLRLSSQQILFAIYVAASLLLLPLSQPQRLLQLDGLHAAMLGYAALNTLVAYGAFAEAIAHWEASRVSAILAVTPLLCLLSVWAVHLSWPRLIAAETVGLAGLAGALLVVAGSSLSSLAGQKPEPRE